MVCPPNSLKNVKTPLAKEHTKIRAMPDLIHKPWSADLGFKGLAHVVKYNFSRVLKSCGVTLLNCTGTKGLVNLSVVRDLAKVPRDLFLFTSPFLPLASDKMALESLGSLWVTQSPQSPGVSPAQSPPGWATRAMLYFSTGRH